MNVTFGIVVLELVELVDPLLRDFVAIVGPVERANLDGEPEVAQAKPRSIVRMAGHHRGGGPTVGHPPEPTDTRRRRRPNSP